MVKYVVFGKEYIILFLMDYLLELKILLYPLFLLLIAQYLKGLMI